MLIVWLMRLNPSWRTLLIWIGCTECPLQNAQILCMWHEIMLLLACTVMLVGWQLL